PQPGAPLLVAVHEHLGIATRVETMAGPLELVHQLAVVVDLSVLHHEDRPVLVRDRLVAAREVDEREPPRGYRHAAVDVGPARIGPAVVERRRHATQPFGVDGAASGRDPADPAHAASLFTCAERPSGAAPGTPWSPRCAGRA